MNDNKNPYIHSDDPNEYFVRSGSGKTMLTKSAALAVCDMLTERGLFVIGTHAGYWRNPGYEERHEYGYFRYPEFYHLSVKENNNLAKKEIAEESDDLDVFLEVAYRKDGLIALRLWGYPLAM